MATHKHRNALKVALKGADWLDERDTALIEAAYAYADAIDAARDEYRDGKIELEDYLAYLHKPNGLVSTLKTLGLAPLERKAIIGGAPAVAPTSKLDELKKRRQQKRGVGG